jgi:hypothetical protein
MNIASITVINKLGIDTIAAIIIPHNAGSVSLITGPQVMMALPSLVFATYILVTLAISMSAVILRFNVIHVISDSSDIVPMPRKGLHAVVFRSHISAS